MMQAFFALAALGRLELRASGDDGGSTSPSAAVIRAPGFKLSIALDTCQAVATYTGDGSRQRSRAGTPVPLLSLYNRVADGRPVNLSPCERAEIIGRSSPLRLRLHAAYGYGSVDVSLQPSSSALAFRLENTSGWHADPVERHLAFGEFWSGILANTTAPVIMGRLQGPRGVPGTGEISAGFMTLSPRSYFRYLFYAEAGDQLAFGFAGPSSSDVAALWTGVAHEHGIAVLSAANRFNTFFWTDLTELSAPAAATRAQALGVETLMLMQDWHPPGRELIVNYSAFPNGINHTVELLRSSYGLKVGLHLHPDIVWPCAGGAHTGLACFTSADTSDEISPLLVDHPDALMAEGLAPTFRSGQPNAHHPTMYSEDLGFWWSHGEKSMTSEDGHHPQPKRPKVATLAMNGNPKPCGQGSCNARDWASNGWAPDLELHECHW